jgi:hypothetical protein
MEAPVTRVYLPNRRASTFLNFESMGIKFTTSFNRDEHGVIREVFIDNHKYVTPQSFARSPFSTAPISIRSSERLAAIARGDHSGRLPPLSIYWVTTNERLRSLEQRIGLGCNRSRQT